MTAKGGARIVRIAAAAAIAALLAFHVVRSAAVADRQAHPALAATLWPSHPAVLTDRALLAIATAAAHRRAVPTATKSDIRRIAARAPLSPDPYLIQGAIAETEGRGRAAEALLIAARDRDPRSRGARFLLADHYLRSGRITAALIEMQVLVSLQSRGLEIFQPTLAAFARSPGAVPQLKAFFAKYPRAEGSVLMLLAGEAANADLVLALANNRHPIPDWRGTLVQSLAAAGQYAKAQAVWAQVSGVRAPDGLFNPAFADIAAPPPFNWALPETGEGVAEPDGKGGIDVLYYGRAKAVLASQLLLLRPGAYRLAMKVTPTAGPEGALRWQLRCANRGGVIASLPLRSGTAATTITVPAGCDAQWLELEGLAADTPQTTELAMHDLRLIAEPAA